MSGGLVRSKSAVLAVVAGLMAAGAPAETSAPPARAAVWMMPSARDNGRQIRDLFLHPEQWAQTRARVDVLGCTDLNYKRCFTDDELKAWFAQMNAWGLKLGMEVGAIKPWGREGAKTFAIERPIWERIERLGGRIHAIAMDEPLLCCRQHIHESDEHAVRETAAYIAEVRKAWPDIRIGDIETYPSIPVADHIVWLDALGKRLAEMKVRGLDFYRIDPNWVEFTVTGRGSWKDLKTLETHCRRIGLPFSLIYWASGYPALERKGVADDATWYTGILQQAGDYALVGGAPDELTIESWIGAPSNCVPETGEFTFTRSVRDLVDKFAGRAPRPATTPAPR